VAAEVAKLAVTLEGPNSPIEAILASTEGAAPGRIAANSPMPSPANDTGEKVNGSLADRMRALQTRASRLTTNP
jgi:hypothetical protein